jgi:hypothetical protein
MKTGEQHTHRDRCKTLQRFFLIDFKLSPHEIGLCVVQKT